MKFTLDPEDYDYLIPNDDIVGFRFTISERQLDTIRPMAAGAVVSPRFHSLVHISRKEPRSELVTQETPPTCPQYFIQSVIQSEKRPSRLRLLGSTESGPFLRNTSAVTLGTWVQQRAFLRSYNRTAFESLQSMTSELITARRDATGAITSMQKMNDELAESLKRSEHLISSTDSRGQTSHLTLRRQCLLRISQLWQSTRELMLLRESSESVHLSKVLRYQTNLRDAEHTWAELLLTDSFYEAKSILTPSVSLLRTILTMVMKYRMLFNNETDPNHDDRISFRIPHAKACRSIARKFMHQLVHIGDRASSAVVHVEHLNQELRNLVRFNRAVRVQYPRVPPETARLPLSSLVVTTFQITDEPTSKLRARDFIEMQLIQEASVSLIFDIIFGYLFLCIFIELVCLQCKQRIEFEKRPKEQLKSFSNNCQLVCNIMEQTRRVTHGSTEPLFLSENSKYTVCDFQNSFFVYKDQKSFQIEHFEDLPRCPASSLPTASTPDTANHSELSKQQKKSVNQSALVPYASGQHTWVTMKPSPISYER
ncbi:unnamed protein product [Dicrocoelium dendriticum]|nr:unnamed protein product [Dicrocoelium dendriticum]